MLIALISAVAIPTLSTVFTVTVEEFTRELSGLFRECRDTALLKDKIVRVRFDLDKQEYWVEEGPSNLLLPAVTEQKTEREKQDEAEKKSPYRIAKEIMKKPKAIPRGVKLVEVLTPRLKSPVTSGEVDFFYFPNGLAENALLRFEANDGQNRKTLIIHPINGTSKLVDGFVTGSESK